MRITPGRSPRRAPKAKAALSVVSNPSEESYELPKSLTKPRSTISATNRLLRAADGLGVLANPLPRSFQTTVSAVGAGVAGLAVVTELADRDFFGALEDTSDGAVSLLGGIRLLGVTGSPLRGITGMGAVLNAGFAARELRDGNRLKATVKACKALGLGLRATSNGVAGSVGLGVLGAVGLFESARYYSGAGQNKSLEPALATLTVEVKRDKE